MIDLHCFIYNLNIYSFTYRKSSTKRRGAKSKLIFFSAVLNRGRRLFEGGANSKEQFLDKSIFLFLQKE